MEELCLPRRTLNEKDGEIQRCNGRITFEPMTKPCSLNAWGESGVVNTCYGPWVRGPGCRCFCASRKPDPPARRLHCPEWLHYARMRQRRPSWVPTAGGSGSSQMTISQGWTGPMNICGACGAGPARHRGTLSRREGPARGRVRAWRSGRSGVRPGHASCSKLSPASACAQDCGPIHGTFRREAYGEDLARACRRVQCRPYALRKTRTPVLIQLLRGCGAFSTVDLQGSRAQQGRHPRSWTRLRRPSGPGSFAVLGVRLEPMAMPCVLAIWDIQRAYWRNWVSTLAPLIKARLLLVDLHFLSMASRTRRYGMELPEAMRKRALRSYMLVTPDLQRSLKFEVPAEPAVSDHAGT